MYFGRFKALLLVTPAVERSVFLSVIKSVARRGEVFASSVAGRTMDKPESEVAAPPDPSAVSGEAVPKAVEPGNGEPRAEWPWKRAKKVAVMISFAGKNYLGMQR